MISIKGIDARQIPKIERICADKRYYDILYSYLQEHSDWDGVQGHPRSIDKSLINFSQLGRALGISRQTASKKVQNLIQLKLLSDAPDADGKYYLSILPSDVAALIPSPTLKLLVDTLSANAISAYIYLLLKYLKNDEQPFVFTLTEVKDFIGICSTTRSNDDVITNILFVLSKIGLIDYCLTTFEQENTQYKDIKTIYRINNLTNYIEI